ncbi:SdrD B-like domain-containing protein [Peptoniphilus phoceensis]|uniref:SdrD B-like domain-containing protein n=1 Tax=Peptoniphilus phoceensis TaxID=1720298 RepID=UPI0007867081|nr:SdrD B-like domain-containing protein [Peptoniphilus phoceensis]
MEKLKEFIEKKKEKSASRKPRYGTRKLSVGLVSCVLGYCIFLSPTVVSAQVADGEVSESTQISETREVSETSKASDTEAVESSKVESPAKEIASETSSREVTEVAEKTETPVKEVAEVEEKKVAEVSEDVVEEKAVEGRETADQAMSREEAPEEITEEEVSEEAVENKETEVEETEEAKIEEREEVDPLKEELQLNEEEDPEALAAGEIEEDAITNVEITIGGAKNGDKTEIVNPTALPDRIKEGTTDINLEAQVDFDIPEGTKQGETFDFVVSDNVNLHGVLESETKGQPVVFDGEEIATAEKLTDGRNGYKYTFNEKVDGLKDIRVRIIYPLFIDPDAVPMGTKEYVIGEDGKYVLDDEGNPVLKADNKETVSVTVAGKTASKDYTVEYENGVFEEKRTGPTLSGTADIDQVTDNNYNHTIYVNPTADQLLNGSHVTVQNEKGYNTVTFDDEVKNSVKVYKVKDPNKLPLSFGNDFNDGNYEDVTDKAEVKLEKDANNADLNKLVVNVKQGNTNESMPFDDKNFDSSSYVITYTGKRTPNKAFKTNTIFTADWRKANGNVEDLSHIDNESWAWTNEIVIDDADAIAIANKTYSLGDKVWIDVDEDGSQGDSEEGLEGVKVILKGINMSDKETTTDANGNYKFEDLKNGEYTVEFEIPSGYAPTTANKDGVTDEKNSDASKDATNNKIATATGTIQGKDNMNVDFGVVVSQEGSFQEHHIYITKDQDGVETGRTTDDGEVKEGKKEETYTTGKIEKDGFEFVRTEDAKNEPTFDAQGEEATGNFKPGVKQEITYVYEKTVNDPQKEKGSFQEHHIYITKDQDGVETGRTTDDGELKEGKKEETYTTGKIEKDGFEFVRTEDAKNEPTFDAQGEEATGNFKPGVKQEITYVYEKTVNDPQKEKGSFQEHHIYITKDQDGKETGRKEEDGKLQEGKKEETYKTGKVEKDGFEFVRTETPVNEPTFDENGAEKTGNYKPGVKQEITYVYEKTETPWTPLEPSTPVNPSEPSKPEEPKDTTPLVPLTPAEEVEFERTTHHDHKTPGTPVVTELPSTPVVETEKPVEEKTEETKEVENKEENVEEVKDLESEDEIVESTAKEKDKNLAPVSTNDDTKAPKTGDAGILSSAGLASLAASGLAYLELKKRNKKNK